LNSELLFLLTDLLTLYRRPSLRRR